MHKFALWWSKQILFFLCQGSIQLEILIHKFSDHTIEMKDNSRLKIASVGLAALQYQSAVASVRGQLPGQYLFK